MYRHQRALRCGAAAHDDLRINKTRHMPVFLLPMKQSIMDHMFFNRNCGGKENSRIYTGNPGTEGIRNPGVEILRRKTKKASAESRGERRTAS